VQIYEGRGLKPELAREVAVALTDHDVIRTHARDELGIDIDDYTNPWSAAIASSVRMLAFGGLGACSPGGEGDPPSAHRPR